MRPLLPIALLAALWLHPVLGAAPVPNQQCTFMRTALCALYNQAGGPRWRFPRGCGSTDAQCWCTANTDPCQWAQVTCGPSGATVCSDPDAFIVSTSLFSSPRAPICSPCLCSDLQLTGVGLVGRVPVLLGQSLGGIQYLGLNNNRNLTGDVTFLSGVTTLIELHLSQTGISGGLDAIIGANAALEEIDVTQCAFVGPFPASLASAPYLRSAELGFNNWTTPLDGLSFNQTSLTTLGVPSSYLSGSLPRLLPPSLVSLKLSENALTGVLPDYFRYMKSLVTLDLSYNQLGGDLDALRMCTNVADPSTW